MEMYKKAIYFLKEFGMEWVTIITRVSMCGNSLRPIPCNVSPSVLYLVP